MKKMHSLINCLDGKCALEVLKHSHVLNVFCTVCSTSGLFRTIHIIDRQYGVALVACSHIHNMYIITSCVSLCQTFASFISLSTFLIKLCNHFSDFSLFFCTPFSALLVSLPLVSLHDA